MCVVLCLVRLSENRFFDVGEECCCGHLDVTSLVLCTSSPFLEYCSPVLGSAVERHLQLLERQAYSVARLCPDQSFCHSVTDVMLLDCMYMYIIYIYLCCKRSIQT